jgi:hypothetical protein
MALIIDAAGESITRTTNLPAPAMTVMVWYYGLSTDNSNIWELRDSGGLDSVRQWQSYDLYGKSGYLREAGGDQDLIEYTGNMLNKWFWCALSLGSDRARKSSMTEPGSSPTWAEATWDYLPGAMDAALEVGVSARYATSRGRYLALKIWNVALSTAQMEAERYYYEPQYTSNVHAWYPLITESSDHSANGYDFTENNSPTFADYTPAGMNALQGGAAAGSITTTITL